MQLTQLLRIIWLFSGFSIFLAPISLFCSNQIKYWNLVKYPPSEKPITIIFPTIYKTNSAIHQQEIVKSNCPVYCRFVSYPNATPYEILTADAIVWHLIWVDINMNSFKWLSWRRSPDQVWGFLSQEPPEILRSLMPNGGKPHGYLPFDRHFNFTLTYRLDSDVKTTIGHLIGYEEIQQHPKSLLKPKHVSIANKKHIAALISNCGSNGYNRIGLLKDMAGAGLEVDIYGGCGVPCPNDNRNSGICKKYLANHYLFYAAFENSLCPDYVSEKFFNSLDLDMVPIVVGGANYSRYVPPDSYINAREFASLENFAAFIKTLASNETAYNEYFEWRSKYKPIYRRDDAVCDLCKKLHHYKQTKYLTPVKQVYYDFDGWWLRHPRTCDASVFVGTR